MIAMAAGATGWFWTALARETGKIGHLYSPGDERHHYPWFAHFALDKGAFPLWRPKTNSFDETRWKDHGEPAWRRLLFWSQTLGQTPQWVLVPDRPGDWTETLRKWEAYAPSLFAEGCTLAVAVQNGATVHEVRSMSPAPSVIFIGGDDAFKWGTVEEWLAEFPRVHVGRVNSPQKLAYLENLKAESCDGTGWNSGDRDQTRGIEEWARGLMHRTAHPLWPHVCRSRKCNKQTSFA